MTNILSLMKKIYITNLKSIKKLTYLLSEPFHCLKINFPTDSLSSLNQISLERGGRIYGLKDSFVTTST